MSVRDLLLAAEGLTYRLAEGRTLFSDLTVSLGRERLGLVGRNGTGKSTLARLLTGALEPTAGSVRRFGRVAYLPQLRDAETERPLADALGIADRLDALERLERGDGDADDLERVGPDWDLRERATDALERAGLGHLRLDRPGGISGGEATRAALAGLLIDRPDLLILDEPTNHLDRDARAALCAWMGDWTGGLLAISHDRALLGQVDGILELSSLGLRRYGGDYAFYRAARDAEADAAQHALNDAERATKSAEREAQRRREKREQAQARGRRDGATANQSKLLLDARKDRSDGTTSRQSGLSEKRVDAAKDRLAEARARVEVVQRPAFPLPSTGLPAGRRVLDLMDVAFNHPGATRPLFEGVTLSMTGPERVAVVGPNGAGKSTLLRVAAGLIAPGAGTVRRGVERVAWLDQNLGGLDPALSVLDNFKRHNPELGEQDCRAALARFLFRNDAALVPAGRLSGGERLRAALACTLNAVRPPELLVLDEPTNHLDLDAVEAVEQALAGYDGAMLLASHDEDFLEAVGVERRLTLRPTHQ
ncbi:ABC-F family ATP-binding cassette domain-containing protein [Azospirillum soli]|uniref:ABC-F family ATP-binding cassette domain-containing protein n=1 Tax=Azospirillum soli TaxID=1304799 RepID=UPI001AE3A2AA|nr:ABC-F family ATP-binding cassette domain-containing protein [Azospirillum soli]MBP2312030.1 ATPase subunit of ABC transporter with duplicated ATPase domains [Azospirillum soli]